MELGQGLKPWRQERIIRIALRARKPDKGSCPYKLPSGYEGPPTTQPLFMIFLGSVMNRLATMKNGQTTRAGITCLS
ncbi:hypothetical protein DEO72_LG8g1271 [Vigna unguiculata]|uniref:Uncharacterized protein n=1 Tax=Vigna unguiculata TaxID=3917 RepID=A0A4D6MTN8_VIGUN|nr:hypothetical protein DEO72_LG8g1271 [Vigna unguiculata]